MTGKEIAMTAGFMWFDLTAANAQEVSAFYGTLFGWSTTEGAGQYSEFFVGDGQPWAGVVPSASTELAGRWVPYVLVDDLEVATGQATSLGGTVVRERTDGPAGTSVVVADPAGALVALFRPAPGPA